MQWDKAAGSYRSRRAIEVWVWKGPCWRGSFQEILQLVAIEVGGDRNRGLERAVLERERERERERESELSVEAG